MLQRYLLHGISVESTLDLRELDTARPADLWFATAPSHDIDGGRVLAERHSGGSDYSVVELGKNRIVVRFPGAYDFDIDIANGRIEALVSPTAARDMLPLFFKGGVLTAYLVVDGGFVLHASAISTPSGIIAFAGGSGAGKSTLAALGCAAGYPLMSDDVLRIQFGGEPAAHRGTRALRLRPGSEVIANELHGGTTRRDPDGRLCVSSAKIAPEIAPLRAVVFPRLLRSGSLALQRLRGSAGVEALLASLRIAGWSDPGILQRQLQFAAALARSTPLFMADVPVTLPDTACVTSLLSRL